MAPRKPKKDPKEAADAAEARSKNKTTAKTVKAPKASKAVAAAKENPDTDKEMKALFLHHLKKLAGPEGLIKAKDDAVAAIRNAYKSAKADGFLKVDFDDAFAIQKADGEKKKKAAIMRSLTIAKWLGCDLGQQLDLFAEPSRVPAVDRAYEEGQSASMLGLSLKCDYDPSTEQYRRFAAGFHDDQENRIKKGIKPLEEAEPVHSGVAMTREEYQRQQSTSHKVN